MTMRFTSTRTCVPTLQECKYTNIPRAFARRDKFMSNRERKKSTMGAKNLNAKATRQISPKRGSRAGIN